MIQHDAIFLMMGQVTYLPVQRGSGLVDLEELEAAVRPDTVACSVMAVNNEIGVVQPLKEIGEICRKNKVFFHSDIAQMLGKVRNARLSNGWAVPLSV